MIVEYAGWLLSQALLMCRNWDALLLLTASFGVQGAGACQLCVVWRCVPLEAGQLPPLDSGRLDLSCSLQLALCRTRGDALSWLMVPCVLCFLSQLWSKVAA